MEERHYNPFPDNENFPLVARDFRRGEKIIHPKDEAEFQNFQQLRNKEFRVKMRIVGNSYAVSIPKEIVEFMHDQEKMMDDFVRVAFDNARKLSLMFGEEEER